MSLAVYRISVARGQTVFFEHSNVGAHFRHMVCRSGRQNPVAKQSGRQIDKVGVSISHSHKGNKDYVGWRENVGGGTMKIKLSFPLFRPSEAYDWKPQHKPLTERQKCWIAVAVSPFAVALLAIILRGDLIRLWIWIFSK